MGFPLRLGENGFLGFFLEVGFLCVVLFEERKEKGPRGVCTFGVPGRKVRGDWTYTWSPVFKPSWITHERKTKSRRELNSRKGKSGPQRNMYCPVSHGTGKMKGKGGGGKKTHNLPV